MMKQTFHFSIIHVLSRILPHIDIFGARAKSLLNSTQKWWNLSIDVFCSAEMLLEANHSFKELFPKGKIAADTI